MIFQKLIWAALTTALIVGSVQSGVQQWQAMPIILAAEAYEGQKIATTVTPVVPVTPVTHAHAKGVAEEHAHDHTATAEEWLPSNGAERIFWTWVANVLHAFSMAMLVFAVMGVCLWRGTALASMPLALIVAAAGWLSFHFWPSLGLHAEIPGMDAARLSPRQLWWALGAISAALACVSLATLRKPLSMVVAAVWLALPFFVGVPHIATDPLAGFSGPAQLALRDLGEQFIWATTWASLSFWASMGLVSGAAFQHWLRPALKATFEGDRSISTSSPAVNL